ncbi:MAG: hypothetical protein ACK5JM_13790 [Rhodoblastus sp.]
MSVAERFNVNFQVTGDRARVALVGSDGTELLMILPFHAPYQTDRESLESAVMSEAEARMKSALLALIAKNWPQSED